MGPPGIIITRHAGLAGRGIKEATEKRCRRGLLLPSFHSERRLVLKSKATRSRVLFRQTGTATPRLGRHRQVTLLARAPAAGPAGDEAGALDLAFFPALRRCGTARGWHGRSDGAAAEQQLAGKPRGVRADPDTSKLCTIAIAL